MHDLCRPRGRPRGAGEERLTVKDCQTSDVREMITSYKSMKVFTMATLTSRVRNIFGMSRAIRLSAVFVTVILTAACGTRPVVTYENESLQIPDYVSMKQVELGIKQAAVKRGWLVERQGPGRLEATLKVKNKFVLIVYITHTTEKMSIRYKGSVNLKYDGTNIHRNANKWIGQLKNTIVKRTSKMTAWKTPPPQTVADSDPTPERPVQTPEIAPRKRSTGSGFFVSTSGHILTNHHVVKGCRTAQASTARMVVPAGMVVVPKPTETTGPGEFGIVGGGELRVLGVDVPNDLALLKSAKASSEVALFRSGRGVRTGDDIVVTGFPLHGLLSSDIGVTKGIVSALAGPGDNRGMIQITAPVQPGNSGGPVLDVSGNVVGVVVGKLDAIKTREQVGSFPENVNFAISAGIARAFLDAHSVPYRTTRSDSASQTADIVARAKGYTVLIECWK